MGILPKTKEVQVRKEAMGKRQAELDDEAVVVKADQKSVDERHGRSIGGAEKRRDQAKEVADKEKKITETESNRMYLKSKSECKKDKENREKLVASDRKLIEEIRPLLESLTRCKGGKAAGRTSAKHTHAKESMLLEVQAQTEVACAANAFIEFPKFGPDTKVRLASAHVELMSLLDMYDPAAAGTETGKATEKKQPLSEVTGTFSNWETRVQEEEKHTASTYASCHGEATATLERRNNDAQTVHDKQDDDANAYRAATIDEAEKEKEKKDQDLKERLEAKVEPRDEANQEWKNAQLEKKRAEEVVQQEEKEMKEALKQSTQVRENEKKAATLDRQDKDKTIKLKLDGEKQRAARERDEKTHSTEEACRVERVALEDEHRIVMEMEDNIEGLAAVRTNAAGVASENGEIEKKETEVKKKQEKEQEKKEKKIEQEKQAEHKAEIEAAGGQEKFESKEMSPIRTKLIEMVEEKFGWLKEDDPMKALMGDLTFKYDTAAKKGDAEPASILSLAGDNILGPVADALAKASDMVKNIPDLIFNRPDPREMLNKLKPPFEAIRSVVEGMKSDEDPMATKMLALATNQKIANFVKEQLDLKTLAKQMFERLNDAVNPPEGGQEPEKFELMSSSRQHY